MPNPASTRPPDTESSEVSDRPSSSGLYQGALSVLIPSRTVLVATAAAVSVTSGSSAAVNSAGYGCSGVPPGYRSEGSSGVKTRSPTHSDA